MGIVIEDADDVPGGLTMALQGLSHESSTQPSQQMKKIRFRDSSCQTEDAQNSKPCFQKGSLQPLRAATPLPPARSAQIREGQVTASTSLSLEPYG